MENREELAFENFHNVYFEFYERTRGLKNNLDSTYFQKVPYCADGASKEICLKAFELIKEYWDIVNRDKMDNWCIRLTDDNRDIVVGYFEKQYEVKYKGTIGHYYGFLVSENNCYVSDNPFGTEIITHEFIEKIKPEGYNVDYRESINKYCLVTNVYKSEILSTSTNNPPINNFLVELDKDTKEVQGTPSYYDNSKGTIYKIAQDRNWNAYVFEAVKRLDRAEKKGEFISDINKTIKVLELYKQEQGHKFQNQIEPLNK